MKRLGILICFFLLIPPSFVFAMAPTAAQKPGAMGKQEAPGIPDEALEWFNEFFKQFSEEELEELSKIGEQYIEEEMRKGKDYDTILNETLSELFEQPTAPQEPTTAAPELPTLPTVPEKAAAPADLKKIDEARQLLKIIIETTTALRHKAEQHRRGREFLAAWSYNLEDLIYYAHKLREEHILKYLTDPEFEALFKTFRQLSHELSFYEPLYQVPSALEEELAPYETLNLSPGVSLAEVETSYQSLSYENDPQVIKKRNVQLNPQELQDVLAEAKQRRTDIEQAYQIIINTEKTKRAIEALESSLSQAIYPNQLFTHAKSVLKKHEPEALKIKEQQEKREAAARKEQEELLKKRPIPAPIIFEPSLNGGLRPDFSRDRSKSPFAGGLTPPAGTEVDQKRLEDLAKPADAKQRKAAEEAKKTKDKEEKKKDEKETGKDKDKKKALALSKTYEDRAKAIKDAFKKLAEKAEERKENVTPQELFTGFADYMTTPFVQPYNKINPDILKAKLVNKSLIELRDLIKKINDAIKNTTDLSFAEKRALKDDAKNLYEEYKKSLFEKDLKDLFNVVTHVSEDGNVIRTAAGDKPIALEPKFAHLAINEIGNIDAPANAPIKDLISIEYEHPKAEERGKQEKLEPVQLGPLSALKKEY